MRSPSPRTRVSSRNGATIEQRDLVRELEQLARPARAWTRSAQWTSSTATTTAPWPREALHPRPVGAADLAPPARPAARLRRRSSSSGSSFSDEQPGQVAACRRRARSRGGAPSFARSFVRTDSSGSPSSEPDPAAQHLDERPVQTARSRTRGSGPRATSRGPSRARGARRGGASCRCRRRRGATSIWPRPFVELVEDPPAAARPRSSRPTSGVSGARLGCGLRADEPPGLHRLVAALHRTARRAARARTLWISAFAVASPTAIVPGSATHCSRAATFVVSPSGDRLRIGVRRRGPPRSRPC